MEPAVTVRKGAALLTPLLLAAVLTACGTDSPPPQEPKPTASPLAQAPAAPSDRPGTSQADVSAQVVEVMRAHGAELTDARQPRPGLIALRSPKGMTPQAADAAITAGLADLVARQWQQDEPNGSIRKLKKPGWGLWATTLPAAQILKDASAAPSDVVITVTVTAISE
ncbi:hypothetical protein [Streptomyces sp. NPDC090022]|uniref:hypothetical protein n=1 Tax=Streptomyces sp. NPDC090022 TaxID=3365920 RepID=UPI00381C40B3